MTFAVSYTFYIVLLSIFSIMRIYRNSLGYESDNVGGVWNVISVFFVLSAVLMSFRVIQRKFNFPLSIRIALCFSVLAQFNCIFFIDNLSVGFLYNFLMIPFFASALVVFFVSSQSFLSQKQIFLSKLLFVAIFLMAFLSVFMFRSGFLGFSMVSNSYYALCILPFALFFTEKKAYRIFIYTLVGIVVIFAGKRTGLIAFVSFIMVVSLLESLMKNQLLDFLKTMLFLIAAGATFYFLYVKFASIYDLQLFKRMSTIVEDGGSGRDVMYQQIWNAMKESNIINWIFGHGYGSAGGVLLKHDTAHNDFLEILYDYGLFAAALIIGFYIQLLREGFTMFRLRYKCAPLFIGGTIISILLSLFSTYLVSFAYVICGMAFLGMVLGDWQHQSVLKMMHKEL